MSLGALEVIDRLSALPEYRGRSENVRADQNANGSVGKGSTRRGKFQLKRRFSELPAFALLAVPIMAGAMAGFLAFPKFSGTIGLDVGFLTPEQQKTAGFSTKPLVIEVLARPDGQIVLHLNSKETTWEKFESSIGREVKSGGRPIAHVEAASDVPWEKVATVVDAVRSHVDDVALFPLTAESRERGRRPTWPHSLPQQGEKLP
jgi:hypothetical protein